MIFSTNQVIGLLGTSATICVLDAWIIRRYGHLLFGDDLRRSVTFLLSLPVGYGMLQGTLKLLDIDEKQMLPAASTMAATMLMIDGLAVMWSPNSYESTTVADRHVSRMGTAWLLWGIGGSLGCVLLLKSLHG